MDYECLHTLLTYSSGRTKGYLAIYVRDVGVPGLGAFVTNLGRGVICRISRAVFHVQNFVDPVLLTKTESSLRSSATTFEDEQEFPVDSASITEILQKVSQFQLEAESIFRNNASTLEDAHGILAHPYNYTYQTLDSAIDQLVKDEKGNASGNTRAQALYAVHRALLNDDVTMRTLNTATLRWGGQYEISPAREAEDFRQAEEYVRKHQDSEVKKLTSRDPAHEDTTIIQFAKRCKAKIQQSRKKYNFTTYGMLRPVEQSSIDYPTEEIPLVDFNATDQSLLRFLKSWAVDLSIPSNSRAHGIAANIIRAVGVYPPEIPISTRLGWTFLQEVGIISPSEIRSPYLLRLYDEDLSNDKASGISDDAMHGLRKDWGSLPIYCVDNVETHEVDDGVSLEPTDKSDEFWVHVHTADPASRIKPSSMVARLAQNMAYSVYMPHKVFSMLPSEFIQTELSLEANRPCLTFSIRVNMKGTIVDTKIRPGVVRNVKFITPSLVDHVVAGVPMSEADETGLSSTFAKRKETMHGIDDLGEADRCNLKILHEISEARRVKAANNGAIELDNTSFSLTVTKGSDEVPRIAIQLPRQGQKEELVDAKPMSSTVKHLMLLAAEAVGRWCHERHIPIPYRVTLHNPALPDPMEYYQTQILPLKGDVPPEIHAEYMSLAGGVVLATAPGPHRIAGLDMMARCTSPLRRFEDLLVHWQVQAAILHEHQTGQKFTGAKDATGKLPYSSASKLEPVLRRVWSRERLIRKVDALAKREWLCRYLVSAWQFGDGLLPPFLHLHVERIDSERLYVSGMLQELAIIATLVVDSNEIGGIEVGNRVKVELSDINVPSGTIEVKLAG